MNSIPNVSKFFSFLSNLTIIEIRCSCWSALCLRLTQTTYLPHPQSVFSHLWSNLLADGIYIYSEDCKLSCGWINFRWIKKRTSYCLNLLGMANSLLYYQVFWLPGRPVSWCFVNATWIFLRSCSVQMRTCIPTQFMPMAAYCWSDDGAENGDFRCHYAFKPKCFS